MQGKAASVLSLGDSPTAWGMNVFVCSKKAQAGLELTVQPEHDLELLI